MPYYFYPIRVISELSILKGVLLAIIMKGNTNRVVSLNDTNYHLWKGRMKDLLFVKKMHLPIMFIITLQVRYMLGLCGRRLNLYMPKSFKEDTSLSDHLNEFEGIID
ncbi:hypothetical protein CR513_03517, partial [Mucuna pruriens]